MIFQFSGGCCAKATGRRNKKHGNLRGFGPNATGKNRHFFFPGVMIIHHGPLIALFSSRVVVYWGGRASQIPMTKKNGGCFCVIFSVGTAEGLGKKMAIK